ncbi:MAG: hypothetical protein C0518_02450 [Opitutus sp.]|nr:hypothetical protein [Opitutus sp.]
MRITPVFVFVPPAHRLFSAARRPEMTWGVLRRALLNPDESRRDTHLQLRTEARRSDGYSMLSFVALALGLAAAPAVIDEHAAWEKLQRGMTPAQAAEIVGVPILRNAARGHELWIYDAGAHIQFHGGAVSAWTQPAAKPASRSNSRRPAAQAATPKPTGQSVGQKSAPTRAPLSPRIS